MNIKNILGGFSLAFLAAAFSLSSATIAEAQGRNAGLSRGDVSNIIRRMEESSDEFRRDFERELDNTNVSGSERNRYRRDVSNFEQAVDRLRDRFDRNNSWWESRSHVQSMISAAVPVNNLMNDNRFRRPLDRQWNRLRNDINRVADTYDLPGIAGGGWTGGGQTIAPPSWAVGTFYGTAPNGTPITLTIAQNGSVNANVGGGMSYGTFIRGNMININGATSRVLRQGNGFRTVSTLDGETINYSRSGWGGGNVGGNVPNWAVGRFRGRSPQDGSFIILTIERGGEVTVNIGGGYSYGTLNGSTLYVDGATSTVYRSGNGIRTVSNTDGQTINYSRY